MKSILLTLVFIAINYISIAQTNPGDVVRYKKIANNTGGLGNVLGNKYYFGAAVSSIGDVNGDGIDDLAAGAFYDDGHIDAGAFYIIHLNTNGHVKSYTKIINVSS